MFIDIATYLLCGTFGFVGCLMQIVNILRNGES